MNLSPTQKQKLIQLYPDLGTYFDKQEGDENVKKLLAMPTLPSEIVAKIKTLRGDRGEKGDKGDPYGLTQSDIDMLVKKATPVKGKDYYEGKDGKDGKNGQNGKDGKDGKQGLRGERGDRGPIGKDGSPDTPLGIANKLNTLEEIIEAKVIRGLPDVNELRKSLTKDINDVKGKLDMRWHGAGLSKVSTDSTLTGTGTASSPLHVASGGGGLTEIVVTGTVNGSNGTFTALSIPTYLVIDGAWYKKLDNNSVVQWSSSGLTITTLIIPSNSIYGF